jgi:hypothetical protein
MSDEEYDFYVNPPEADPHGLNESELLQVLEDPSDPMAPAALRELARRSPDLALTVARALVTSSADWTSSAALEVLAELDFADALQVMQRLAARCSSKLMTTMAVLLAVDHPVDAATESALLDTLGDRLAEPRSAAEVDAADLFFRRYPRG